MKRIINLTLWCTLLMSISSCGAALFSQGGGSSDDMYGVHNSNKIIAQQQAEIAQLKAKQAEYEAIIKSVTNSNDSQTGVNPYLEEYDSEYARKLYGFESDSYSPPSSYYALVYSPSGELVASYDPTNYNVVIENGDITVEPKYTSSMLGYWDSVAYFSYIHNPHRWRGGHRHYYSMWGYPYYSWSDWYWYGSYWSYYSPYWGYGYYPYYSPSWYGWYGPSWGSVAHKKPSIKRPVASSRSIQSKSRYVPTSSATRYSASSSTRSSSNGGSRYNFSDSNNSSSKTQYSNSGGRGSSSSKVYNNSLSSSSSSKSSSSSSRSSSSSYNKSSSSSSRTSSSYSTPSTSSGSRGGSSSFSTSGARGR